MTIAGSAISTPTTNPIGPTATAATAENAGPSSPIHASTRKSFLSLSRSLNDRLVFSAVVSAVNAWPAPMRNGTAMSASSPACPSLKITTDHAAFHNSEIPAAHRVPLF